MSRPLLNSAVRPGEAVSPLLSPIEPPACWPRMIVGYNVSALVALLSHADAPSPGRGATALSPHPARLTTPFHDVT